MDAVRLGWYLFALVATIVAATVNTGADLWLDGLPRPLPVSARLVLGVRWAFFFSILLFAWLIDSGRVPYEEAGLWMLIVAGALGTLALAYITRTKRGQ